MKKNTKHSGLREGLSEAINEMSDGDRNSLLLELESTNYWVAIMKYLLERQGFASDGLKTMDPVKDLVSLCRTQGTLAGLSDLPNAVAVLKEGSRG